MARTPSWLGALPIASIGLGACANETVAPLEHTVVLESEGYSVELAVNAVTIALKRGDEVLTTIDGEGLSIGTVDAVDPLVNYDPYPIVAAVEGYFPPAGTAFHAAKKVVDFTEENGAIHATLEHDGGAESDLDISISGEGSFRISMVPRDATQVAWARISPSAVDGEAFYGLGEHFDDVNQRGKIRAMQMVVDSLESANNEAHVPVPLVIGTRGWGMFVESVFTGVFDVAESDPRRVTATYSLVPRAAEGLVVHLLAAEQPLDVTKRYYEITGYPRLPAPWALGPLVWRNENDDQAQVESDLDTMRELDLAASGIWIDRPYATGVNTFDFDASKFPDAPAMIEKAHDLGFRVGVWHTPYLDESDASTEALRAEATENGYYPVEIGITFNNWGPPIDFTAEGAMAWWQSKLADYVALGIEGYKLDYAEDFIPGTLFGVRNVYELHDGSDERTMHYGYTRLYHQTYAETLPDEGGLLLCRAGRWGDQTSGAIIWPGDLDAQFWKHRQEVTFEGETFSAVGGLPASVVAGLTLGPSGFPFYGADTGGYRHSPPDKELFRRWFEQTALSSVMQIGTASNDVAWEFGDEALLDSYREYTRLHLRLFPYEWSLAKDIAITGRPIQRPFGLAFPELGVHPSDQYMFGDALLVAPVLEPGVDERSVTLPEGSWLDYWDGTRYEGPGDVTVPAPLGRLPLFLRAGSLVPMLRPTIDTLSPTTEPALVDSFASDAGVLHVLTSAGPDESFELYDGGELTQTTTGDDIAFGYQSGSVFESGVIFEVVAFAAAPSAVRVDGDALESAASMAELETATQGFYFDASARGGTLYVKLAAGTAIVTR